jgi:hypothetical protein
VLKLICYSGCREQLALHAVNASRPFPCARAHRFAPDIGGPVLTTVAIPWARVAGHSGLLRWRMPTFAQLQIDKYLGPARNTPQR